MSGARAQNCLVALLLLASGFSALLFQTAWMREYRLIFGATTAASGVVLGVFMAGLGIGNAVLGGFVERRSRPLFWYGLFEVLIAASVAVSPSLIDAFHRVYLHLGGQSTLGMAGATAVRVLLSALVMGVPAVLMGGTFPAAARSVTGGDDRRRVWAALVYSANTLGSVAGVLATTFALLEHWGTRSTLLFGCLVNLVIGTVAILVGRRETASPVELPSVETATAPRLSAGQWALLACSMLFGFGFFLMEIVWFRMLSPLLGGTTFAFGIILSGALLGIGLGSLAYAAAGRFLRLTWTLLALTSGLEAVFVVWPYWRGDDLALATAVEMVREGETFSGLVSVWMKTSFAVVFGASVCSGFQFPLMIALMGEARRGISRQIGWLFAANTFGAIAGSLAGGLGLLPRLTAPGCWILVVGLFAAISLSILVQGMIRKPTWGIAGVIVPLLAISLTLSQGPTAVWRHSGIGARRFTLPDAGANPRRQWENTQRRSIHAEAEGVEASLAIQANDGYSFVVNGKSDGHAVIDVGTQIGLGLVGVLSHPAPQECLVVGLGTGETAGWLADMPGVERVTVVELEPKVDEIARLCSAINRNVLEHPRVERVYNDAREVLMTGQQPLDLIISEPSNPYRVGIATLYTREFYQCVRSRLREDGVFCQWLQGYEIDQATIDIVLATLRTVFADVQVWRTEVPDLVFVCSNAPIRYDADVLTKRTQDPVLREAIWRAWRTTRLDGVFARHLANSAFVADHVERAAPPLNTDDRTILEYRLAKTLGKRSDFPVDEFWQAAHRAGGDVPAGLAGRLPHLADERLALYYNQLKLLVEPGDTGMSPDQQRQRAMLSLVLANQPAAALEMWKRHPHVPDTYAANVLLGLAAADAGDPLAMGSIAALEADAKVDATILRAVAISRGADAKGALPIALEAIGQLEREPWGHPVLIQRLLGLVADLADALDEAECRRVFDRMKTPFSCRVAEDRRRVVRYLYAERLGPEAVAESLSEFEPHVPWTESVLKARRDAYRALRHPLADRAETEWQRFRSQQRTFD